jgi:hypothetical protein
MLQKLVMLHRALVEMKVWWHTCVYVSHAQCVVSTHVFAIKRHALHRFALLSLGGVGLVFRRWLVRFLLCKIASHL